MGCEVRRDADSITVVGRPLRGIDVDMNAISDTVQTLAVVALFAEGPTTIRNVGHIRHKETDRIAAVATELRKLGATVEERDDGLTITPGELRPATIDTYDDHRMAMSFALAGLRQPGVRINDPGCTGKDVSQFFRRSGARRNGDRLTNSANELSRRATERCQRSAAIQRGRDGHVGRQANSTGTGGLEQMLGPLQQR